MSYEGCNQPYCLSEGDWLNSLAEPGRYTPEPGYIAHAEINWIIFSAEIVSERHDDTSDTELRMKSGI